MSLGGGNELFAPALVDSSIIDFNQYDGPQDTPVELVLVSGCTGATFYSRGTGLITCARSSLVAITRYPNNGTLYQYNESAPDKRGAVILGHYDGSVPTLKGEWVYDISSFSSQLNVTTSSFPWWYDRPGGLPDYTAEYSPWILVGPPKYWTPDTGGVFGPRVSTWSPGYAHIFKSSCAHCDYNP